jgi:hypothetical protein
VNLHRFQSPETAFYKHFKPSDKVRTIFGGVPTVREQRGYQVFVVKETDNAWQSRTRKPRAVCPVRDQRALVAIGALLIVAIVLFGLINKFTEKHPFGKQVNQTERYERRGCVRRPRPS